jgi:hypothetical protein
MRKSGKHLILGVENTRIPGKNTGIRMNEFRQKSCCFLRSKRQEQGGSRLRLTGYTVEARGLLRP